MAIQHDPAPSAGQDIIDKGCGIHDEGPRPMTRRWWLWLVLLALLVAGGVYAISRGCDGTVPPLVPPTPTAPAPPPPPPAFEEIVLEVDSIEYLRSCLAASGTEAECQATLGDLVKK